jgi:hypothetical protein
MPHRQPLVLSVLCYMVCILLLENGNNNASTAPLNKIPVLAKHKYSLKPNIGLYSMLPC